MSGSKPHSEYMHVRLIILSVCLWWSIEDLSILYCVQTDIVVYTNDKNMNKIKVETSMSTDFVFLPVHESPIMR